VGLEGGFELFMQLLGTYFNWLRCSCWNARQYSQASDISMQPLHVERPSAYPTYCT